MFDCVACYYFTKKVSCIFIHWGHKADKQINIWFFCAVASLLYFMFCLLFHPLKNVQISCKIYRHFYLVVPIVFFFFFFFKSDIRCSIETGIKLKNIRMNSNLYLIFPSISWISDGIDPRKTIAGLSDDSRALNKGFFNCSCT